MSLTSRLLVLTAVLALAAGCGQNTQPPSPPDATDEAKPAAAATGSSAGGSKGAEAASGEALVRVNGQPVSRQAFAAMLAEWDQRRPGSVDSPQIQSALLNEMINFTILRQEAEQRNLASSEQVAGALEWARTKTLAQAMLNEHLSENPVDEEAVRQAYEKEYLDDGDGAEEYRARHILVETSDRARELIVELEEGADFAELAQEHSTGPSGSRGGDLGWFGAGDMVEPFADAVAELEPGGFSSEPVETEFGWHVILLEEVRQSPPPPLESVEEEIRSQLRQKRIQDYMSGLRAEAEVEARGGAIPPPGASGAPSDEAVE